MLNVRVKKALLTILTACLTVLMTIGAVLGFTPTSQTVKADGTQQFVKVTAAPADWSGEYLIVYEAGNVAFKGSLTSLDATKNNVSVEINDGVIAYSDELNNQTFTIAKSGTSYTIQSASGYYIGNTANSNKLNSSTSTQYTNTITLNSDGSVHIVGSGNSVLRYNSASDQLRFRYFKSSSYSNQKAIHLYRLEDITSGDTECQHTNAEQIQTTWDTTVAGQHKQNTVCYACNTVIEVGEAVDCTITWDVWKTENGKHSRTGKCDVCEAEMTESGACEVSNATYESVSDTKHNAIGTCDTCGKPTAISENCVYTKTAEDDNGVTYECESCDNTYTNLKYTITFHVPGGIAPVAAVRVEEGKTEALPTEVGTYEGYTFAGWTTESGYEDTTSPAIYASYTMGEENVDLYALYTYTEGSTETGYVKVTAANQLAVNDTIVIAANGSNVALGADRGNNRSAVAITKDGDTIEFEEDAGVVLITLEEGKVEGTFAFSTDTGYLYAASSGNNQLKTKATLDEHGSWKIEINNGVATIKAPESSNRSWVRYNSTNNPPIFSCYSSGQADVCIYKLVSGTTHYLTDIGPKIASANLTLGEELVMNYKVAMDASYAGAQMTFTMNGESVTVSANDELVDGLYVYSFAIAPQFMGANIAAELKLGETVLASKTEYCVKDYIDYQLENTTGEEMTNLLNALLQYGAAAQMKQGYDTENLVADLSNLGNVPEESNNCELTAPNANYVCFSSAGLRFSSDNTLYVRLNGSLTGNVKLYVNGAEATLNGNVYYTEGLKATQFGDEFIFELRDGETVIQTLTYSVNAYAYALQNSTNEDMANLAKALYNYGVSADAYVATLGN